MKRYLQLLALLCLITLTTGSALASGVKCDTIKNEIKKERNLLKKRALLDRALELCPQDAEVYYSYAFTAERLRKYSQAQKYYLKATQLDSNHAKAHFGLGDIYMVLGNAKAAINAFEKGLALVPQNKRARRSLSLAQIKQKSAVGKQITAAEFIQVMQESKAEETTHGAIDGPLLRMQIHFYSASSQLSAQAMEQLINVGKALEDPTLSNTIFEISGHTDDTGSSDSNLILSKHRAEQVRKYLLERFSIRPEALIVAYYGDTRPVVANSTTQNRAQNRRVEFKRIKK